MTTGERLAAAQLRGHIETDRVYAPIAAAAAAAVMRHATPDQNGVLRLTIAARAIILHEIGQLLDRARPELFVAILAAVGKAVDAAQAGVEPLPIAERPTPPAGPVWVSLERGRENVISQTGALLVRGIAVGAAASAVATSVRQYFSPWFAARRAETGRLLRADRVGAIASWPGRSGMASASARAAMLTETTAAHGRTMVALAQRDDTGLRWRLSPSHSKTDECTANARRDVGWGPGVFSAREFPPIPSHPRCRCFAESVPLVPR